MIVRNELILMSSSMTMTMSVYIKMNKPINPSEAADSSESSKYNFFNDDEINNDLIKSESAVGAEYVTEFDLLLRTSATFHRKRWHIV